MRTKANDLHEFSFKKISSGAYQVVYTHETKGDYWSARIEYMPVIDATKNAEHARMKDIAYLKFLVKKHGTHYHKDGTKFLI